MSETLNNMRRRLDRARYWLRVFVRSLPFVALLSCGGQSANTVTSRAVLATAEMVAVSCPRVYDAIIEDRSVSIGERRYRLRGARFACEMLLHEIARSAQ